MTISQIKALIGQPVLNMARQLDVNGAEQPWVSHWDNANRVRVTMHDDVFNAIKANPAFDLLAVKDAKVVETPGKAPYTRYVIITPKQLLATF